MNGVKRNVHFLGVGGIGMSGLAEILLNLGYAVSGSDLRSSEITKRLQTLGLRFFEGHEASQVDGAGIVVTSAAIRDDNVELLAAREAGTPVIHRSDLLADLVRLKPNAVVVAGSHGKTTTTSMISAFLDQADFGSTSIVGGILHRSGTNARWGAGEYLVAEADEHDGSFLRLHPTIGVVTNIDAEHLDYYGTLDRIKRAFEDFCNATPFYGYSILCWDDPNTRSILSHLECVYVTYGLGDGADLVGSDIRLRAPNPERPKLEQLGALRTEIEVWNRSSFFGGPGRLGALDVNAVGSHNVRNALGACAVGLALGIGFDAIAEGLRSYDGVQRRLQVCGHCDGIAVVEDYAHHPTELASTLEAVGWIGARRVIVIFQPHLYSRTMFFCEDFARVLSQVDRAIVTDIYPAREDPMPGVDSALIVDAARAQGATRVELINDMNAASDVIAPDLSPGDLVLILGAGNINSVAERLIRTLRNR